MKASSYDRTVFKIKVDYAFQDLNDLPEGYALPEGRVKPWGTTHAILAARDLITSNYAVINADDFYGADSFVQIAKYFAETQEANDGKEHLSMVGYKLANTLSDHGNVNRGICKDTDGYLNEVEECTEILIEEDGICRGENLAGNRVPISTDAIASMNFWGFTPAMTTHLQAHFVEFLKQRGEEMKSECYIPTVVDELITNGTADCVILETSSSWFGVTYPDDKAAVVSSIQKLVANGEYPASLWA